MGGNHGHGRSEKTGEDDRRSENLSGGKWQSSTAKRWGEVFNPSSGKVIAKVPLCGADDVDRAVQSAAAALPKWAETPVVDRARSCFNIAN